MGFPGLSPSSVERTPEKISSRYAFPRGWELEFIGGEKSKPPSGTKGRQPACVLKPLFGRNGLASPKGDLQICSEVGNSRGRVLVPDRVKFTRALLESKDLSMWFFFPCAFGAPGSAPAPWKQTLRKDLQDPLFPEAGMWGS